MGLFSSIKSFLGLDKKEEVLQEVNTELFLEAVKKATIVEASKATEQVPTNSVPFPVTTPDPVVVDTESVKETLEVKVEAPKKEKKVVVKKEQKVEVAKAKPVAEKQKQKKTK